MTPVFRVTRIDLDKDQQVSSVHAVADDDTVTWLAGLGPGAPDQYGREEPPEWEIPLAHRDLRMILIERGVPGYSTAALWTILRDKGHVVARETLHGWLSEDERTGYVHRAVAGRVMHWSWALPPGAEAAIPGMSLAVKIRMPARTFAEIIDSIRKVPADDPASPLANLVYRGLYPVWAGFWVRS